MKTQEPKNKLLPLSQLAPLVGVKYVQLWKWATAGVEGIFLEVKQISHMESSVELFEQFRDQVTEAKKKKRFSTTDSRSKQKRLSQADKELQKRGY